MSVITHFLSKLPINPVRARRSRRFTTVAAVASLAMLGGSSIAHAQTTGQQIPVTGGDILALLGFSAFQVPNSLVPGGTPAAIDYSPVTFNYIANPYMAVVQGVTGSYPVAYAANQLFFGNPAITLTHNVPGMLSFGNLGGSLRIANDNKRALNGFGFGDFYGELGVFGTNGGGVPAGYGVWPLPGYLLAPAIRRYDYSAYVSTNVDGVLTNGTVTGGDITEIVGNDENWIIEPTFRSNAGDNFLLSEAQIEDNCVVHQEVRLFRNTAQLRWQIRNTDTISHTVYLKFAVNNPGGGCG